MASRTLKTADLSDIVVRRAEPNEAFPAALLTFQVLWETGRSDRYRWPDVVDGVRRVFAAQPGGGYYFAMAHGRHVGQLKLVFGYSDLLDQRTAMIEHVYVHPDRRGGRIFDRLFAHAVDVCRSESVSMLQLHVVTANQPAIRAYTKRGLEHTGFWMTRRIRTAADA